MPTCQPWWFTSAINTDHDDDTGLVGTRLLNIEATIRVTANQVKQLVLQRGSHLGGVGLTRDAGIGFQIVDQLRGGLGADVRQQQCVFDILPIRLRQVVLGQNVEQRFAKGIAGFGELGLEPGQAGAD